MKYFASVIFVFSFFQLAQAQTFKVLKIQGKKAIVEIDESDKIQINKTYSLTEDNGGGTKSKKGSFKRDRGIDFNFNFTSTSTSGSSSSSTSIDGTYLWNLKKYEIGPTLGLTSSDSGGASTSSTSFGGIGFYNFTENKPSVESLWSITGGLLFSSSSGSGSTTRTIIQLGPNYRWFLLSGDHCFSVSALFRSTSTSGSSSSGLILSAGIATYF